VVGQPLLRVERNRDFLRLGFTGRSRERACVSVWIAYVVLVVSGRKPQRLTHVSRATKLMACPGRLAIRTRIQDHASAKHARIRAGLNQLLTRASSPVNSGLRRITGIGVSAGAIRRDQSRRTTLRRELLIFKPPLYSINPSFRNFFMKKLTRERVVPTISASVS
jgi:hypothetical protein